jgi:magnesium chelatase subunit I
MEQERTSFEEDGFNTVVPEYIKEILAEITHLARRSSDISQRSGVSVRVTICNYETVLSAALKRSIRLREAQVTPRVSDLSSLVTSTAGKIELDSVGEGSEEKILDKLVQRAVLNVFNRHLNIAEMQELVQSFDRGLHIEVAPDMPSLEYMAQASEVAGLSPAISRLGAMGNPASVASAMEFVLEGLHLSRKLNKDRTQGSTAGRFRYGS